VYAARGSHPSPAFQELVYEVARIYYRDPLAYLDTHTSCVGITVRFDELVTSPLDTVTGLYDRLGYGITPAFRQVLATEQAKSRAYRSVHRYTLEQFGIPAERIVRDLDEVFTRFGFARTVNSPAVPSSDGVTSERVQRSNP
jgi:hypothetical protein